MSRGARPAAGVRRASALVSALFGIVLVGTLAAAIFNVALQQNRVMKSHEQAVRARLLAETGVTHAVAVLRGPLATAGYSNLLRGADNAKGTADDGYLIDFGTLDASLVVPVAGRTTTGGKFEVRLLDDPAETDGDSLTDQNGRVRIRCVGTTVDGATATVNVILRGISLPALVFDGNVTINGNARILGQCSDVHANGRMELKGGVTLDGRVTTADTVVVSGGSASRLDGSPITPSSRQPKVEVPSLKPEELCTSPAFVLGADGWITRKGAGSSGDDRRYAVGTAQFGWRYDLVYKSWILETSNPTPGTVCAYSNVAITQSFGSAAAPIPMSIISTGSVYLTGSPFIRPSSPDGALIVAGGDIQMSGSASAGAPNYEGLLYATNQCKFTGNPRIAGQVICKDDPANPNAYNITNSNDIAGNPEITYSCNDAFGRRRRLFAWYPTFGQ